MPGHPGHPPWLRAWLKLLISFAYCYDSPIEVFFGRRWRSGSIHLSSEIRRFNSFPCHGAVIGITMYGIGREGGQSLFIHVNHDYAIALYSLKSCTVRICQIAVSRIIKKIEIFVACKVEVQVSRDEGCYLFFIAQLSTLGCIKIVIFRLLYK